MNTTRYTATVTDGQTTLTLGKNSKRSDYTHAVAVMRCDGCKWILSGFRKNERAARKHVEQLNSKPWLAKAHVVALTVEA